MTPIFLLERMHYTLSTFDESIAPHDKLVLARAINALAKFDPSRKLPAVGSKRRGKINQHFHIIARVLGSHHNMDPELLDPAHMIGLAKSYIHSHGNPVSGRGAKAKVTLGHGDLDSHITRLA